LSLAPSVLRFRMRCAPHTAALLLAATMLAGCNDVAADPPPRKMPFLPKDHDPTCPLPRGLTDKERGFRLPDRCRAEEGKEQAEGASAQ
jgi:hypothetical protein